MKNLGLIPLKNFYILDEDKGIYRAAQPDFSWEYKFIKEKLNVHTIINLRKERDIDNRFAKVFGIEEKTFYIPDHHCPTLEEANEFMEFVKNATQPFLFHCLHGRGRTSTFCVLARIALGWNFDDAIKEEEDLGIYISTSITITIFNSKF